MNFRRVEIHGVGVVTDVKSVTQEVKIANIYKIILNEFDNRIS